MSTSSRADLHEFKLPVISLEYKSISELAAASAPEPVPEEISVVQEVATEPMVTLPERELQERLQQARDEGAARTLENLSRQYEENLSKQKAAILEAVTEFRRERAGYYSRVEKELVELALSIAAKILHREAQVDRTLLGALVKVAIENLQHRTNIAVRVRPEEADLWREYLAENLPETKIEVIEDANIAESNCVLETELGTAEIGIASQLKEIERGFFDLLSQRPDRP